MSRIRRVVGDEAGVDPVQRVGPGYRLAAPEAVSLDTEEFERSLRAALDARATGDDAALERELRRALTLAERELLPEDGPAEWVVRARDELAVRVAAAAEELATALLGQGRVAAAVDACERGLLADRCRDGLWRTLDAALERLGDPAQRGRAAQRYGEVLAELGVPSAPSARTVRPDFRHGVAHDLRRDIPGELPRTVPGALSGEVRGRAVPAGSRTARG